MKRQFSYRLFSALMASALAMSVLLSACQKKSEEGETKAKSQSIEIFTRFSDGPSKAFFEEAAQDYMSEHEGVTITVSSANNQNYKQEINVRLSSQKTPDIYFAWSGVYAQNFADGGQALDLTPYFETDQNWKDSLVGNQFAPYTFQNKIYGIPLMMDGKVFYYNKEIFKKLNLEVPKTWDELLVVLDVLKKADYIPISLGNSEDWATGHYMTTLNQRCVAEDVLTKDYALKGDFSDPGYIKALEHLQELVPYFTPECNSVSYDQGISDFTTGKAGLYYEQFNQVQYIAPAKFEWSWFNFPAIPDGKGRQDALTGAPQGLMVSAKTASPDLCVDFLKFLTTKERAAKMVKETQMISTVKGAITEENAEPYMLEIAKTIQDASEINLWLDNVMQSEVAATYLQKIQAMVASACTPVDVMTAVREKANEVQHE